MTTSKVKSLVSASGHFIRGTAKALNSDLFFLKGARICQVIYIHSIKLLALQTTGLIYTILENPKVPENMASQQNNVKRQVISSQACLLVGDELHGETRC